MLHHSIYPLYSSDICKAHFFTYRGKPILVCASSMNEVRVKIRDPLAFLCALPVLRCRQLSSVFSEKKVHSNHALRPCENRTNVTMLRVQKKRRPEDWDKKMSSLSGRFLPLDPGDETVLEALDRETGRGPGVQDSYDADEPSVSEYGDYTPVSMKKWSKRSEAARKRWADPAYRAKMLQKRAEKRRRDAEAAGEQPKAKVEIGRMDSITLCNDEKAKAINDYARSNQLRSEKITAFHHNRTQWMADRLSNSPARLSDEEYVQQKLQVKERRRMSALRREEAKAKKEQESKKSDEEI